MVVMEVLWTDRLAQLLVVPDDEREQAVACLRFCLVPCALYLVELLRVPRCLLWCMQSKYSCITCPFSDLADSLTTAKHLTKAQS
jgi:hypothetical protein